jgi:hypothetical protein
VYYYPEFECPDLNTRRSYFRQVFLDAVSEHAQHVLQELHTEPLRLYRQLAAEHGPTTIRYTSHNSASVELLNLILDKSRPWNLNAPWFHEAAFKTIKTWYHLKRNDEKLHFAPIGFGGKDPTRPIIRFGPPKDLPVYDPLFISQVEYLKKARAIEEKKLRQQITSAPTLQFLKSASRQWS